MVVVISNNSGSGALRRARRSRSNGLTKSLKDFRETAMATRDANDATIVGDVAPHAPEAASDGARGKRTRA
jgi:hypothetical protein